MLLNALVAMGMLAKREGFFSNSPLTARYLAAGSPDNSRMAQMHAVHLWRTWSHLTDSVRTGTCAPGRGPGGGELWTRAFIAAMHHNSKERAPLAVKAIGTENVARVLDVGGGSGAYAIAFAQAEPRLRVDLLDRPEVLPIAGEHIAAAGLSDRISTRPGDLRSDSLGSGYDVVLLSAICHMLSPGENRDLLRRCREALAPGGRIAIQDFILSADKTAPKFAALFSLNMLVGTAGGASYTEDEYTAWLAEAGFEHVRHLRLPGPSGIMLAVRR
jgi:predicted O-methyltransferase YrrM